MGSGEEKYQRQRKVGSARHLMEINGGDILAEGGEEEKERQGIMNGSQSQQIGKIQYPVPSGRKGEKGKKKKKKGTYNN